MMNNEKRTAQADPYSIPGDLTNEALTKKFPSSFDLVNFAIDRVSEEIHAGREIAPEEEGDNPAVKILHCIATGEPIGEASAEESVEEEAPEAEAPSEG